MRTISVACAVWIGFSFTLPPETPITHRLIVQPTSTVIIDGKMNNKTFQCSTTRYNSNDTLVLRQEKPGQKPVFTQGTVKAGAAAFDCGMKVMTRDFLKTIDAEQYPDIKIQFVSFERLPRYQPKEERFKTKMRISLSATTQDFDVTCAITKDEAGYIHLKGGRHFKFSDFKLTPPSKMGGIIKVNENIDVNFHLILLKQ
jgi:hypothetical protein